MIEAVLMVGDRIVGIHKLAQLKRTIRLEVSFAYYQPISATNIVIDDSTATATAFDSYHTITRNRIIFEGVRQLGPNRYEYQYRHTEDNKKYSVSISENIGLLNEPTDKVNMDILKSKLRDNKKMKDLLLKYYRLE